MLGRAAAGGRRVGVATGLGIACGDLLQVIADIAVDQKENVFPMIPSGAAHNEMLLGPEHQDRTASITDEGLMLV